MIKPKHLVFEIHKNITSSQTIKKIYPKSEFKVDTKNLGKCHFNLTTGRFLFSKYKTIKGLHWMTCVRSLTKKRLDFPKIFSKTNISLISFQQLDLNRHNLWSMRFDSRTRKIIKHRRTSIESAKSLIEMTLKSSTLLEKLSSWGQYSGPWEGKTSSIQISYEAMKDDWMMNQWTEDNGVQRKIINRRAHSDHAGGNVVPK